jgi:hypothetical protein
LKFKSIGVRIAVFRRRSNLTAMWFYQLDNADWSINDYRLDVWEGERWEWRVFRATEIKSSPPKPGDQIVFFYAPHDNNDPGFYGWAIITQWIDDGKKRSPLLLSPGRPQRSPENATLVG